ncbi:Glutathione-regulated potassium-efflux system ATP-binding protein [Photobacterium marinum]|uniref:Glutathione-regulated potassium-efflux system ATP-binding protein n=1 Tax=Photobacterium marinum TaxID=1056511 RepID=L8J9P5_9GAMM|nr:ABC-F family ATP-binding cassette domain-containing protein [Photobacterium marinum]ELR65600.1 Glutathione-regulated potassium-efflux system ATP-binding protein [Photobacterium marinum]
MSTLLSAQSVSYELASGPLLEGISFTLNKGDRIGLIGHNGCGKSTLLKLLDNQVKGYSGQVTQSSHCIMARVEQSLSDELYRVSLLDAVTACIPKTIRHAESWRGDLLLSDMGFSQQEKHLTAGTLSGGQHTRLLLARALINQPDLLLLDEPSNHLDLPTLLWLESFLKSWHGSFILVSHDQRLLDNVTNCTWILRDKKLHFFRLPCSQARQALASKDENDQQRYHDEQKEINRVEKSAKRLALWGKIYDNEDLARKAKSMEKRIDKMKEAQTKFSSGTPWQLRLKSESLPANRLLEIPALNVRPEPGAPVLFKVMEKQLRSGDRIAVLGHNGTGKSSLLRHLWHCYQRENHQAKTIVGKKNQRNKQLLARDGEVVFHPRCRLGYYDQGLKQLNDQDTLLEGLRHFAPLSDEERKMALINAGFPYIRHNEKVRGLSGGERARLLFVGLTLANYHLLFLDEPTNHLDLEGKEDLGETLGEFSGGFLLVSHDRELIEKSCNRFWLVENGHLTEWRDLDQLYQSMAVKFHTLNLKDKQGESDMASEPIANKALVDDELLLDRLVKLETKLAEDLARKMKHQKPARQEAWKREIHQLNEKLELIS